MADVRVVLCGDPESDAQLRSAERELSALVSQDYEIVGFVCDARGDSRMWGALAWTLVR